MQFFLTIFRRENTFFPIRDAKKKTYLWICFLSAENQFVLERQSRNSVFGNHRALRTDSFSRSFWVESCRRTRNSSREDAKAVKLREILYENKKITTAGDTPGLCRYFRLDTRCALGQKFHDTVPPHVAMLLPVISQPVLRDSKTTFLIGFSEPFF